MTGVPGEAAPAAVASRPDGPYRRLVLLAWIGISFLVYMSNGLQLSVGDSTPAALIPVTLLLDGTVMLDRFDEEEHRRFPQPYWLIETPSGTASAYPIATGVLVTPILALPIALHAWRHPLSTDAWRDLVVDRYQKRVAAFIAALSVAVFWSLCRSLRLGSGLSIALTCLYAFGSEALAISAQCLWQHGPGSLAVLCLIHGLLALERRPLLAAVSVGLFTGLAVAIRPNNMALVAPLMLAGLHQRPRHWPAVIAPAIAVLAPVVAYNGLVFGNPLGNYGLQSAELSLGNMPAGIMGLLFSPARGLFVYFPAALLLLVLLARWPGFRRNSLACALAAGTVLLALLHAAWSYWSGGWCFGPRFFAESQGPMLLLLGMAFPQGPRAARAAAVALAVILPYSIMVQVLGAFSPATAYWNSTPAGDERARLWDVADNPLFRGLRANLEP
jgi:hypothetical protein